MNKKKLIITVEFQNRELKGACILASVFVKKGWDVYIGQKQQFFPLINMFSRAVWYVKSVVPGEQGILQKLKNENHFIASYDVEGLMLNPHTKFGYKTRYSTKNIKLVDSASATAKEASIVLKKYNLKNTAEKSYSLDCFVTDLPMKFERLGKTFLGEPIGNPQLVNDI